MGSTNHNAQVVSLLFLALALPAVSEVVSSTAHEDRSSAIIDRCESSLEYSTRIQLAVMPGDGNFSYIGDSLIPGATGLTPTDVTVTSYEVVTVNNKPKGRQRLYQQQNSGSNIRLQTVTGERRGRMLFGTITVGVDECNGEFDSGVRMQLRIISTNRTAMAAFKSFVEDGEFERGIVNGEACAAEVKGRAFAKKGVEIKGKTITCNNKL
jgi:hypothetical protein